MPSTSSRFLALIAALVLGTPLLAEQAPAQPSQDPPELRAKVKELRESPDVAHAALRAEELRTGDQAARGRLLDVLEDPGVPIHVLDGILISLMEKNDRADGVVGRLFTIYAKAQGVRRERLEDALRRYDARGPILDEPLALILSGDGNGARKELIAMAVILANTDIERRDVVRTLAAVYEREKSGPLGVAARAGLVELTYQEWKTPEDWSAWLARFNNENPNGFSTKALVQDAIRQAKAGANRRAIEEAKRAIQNIVAAKALPVDYLEVAKTPDAEVRVFAAQRMLVAVTQLPELAGTAVAALGALMADPDPSVQQEALKSLGALAQMDPKFGPRVAEVALKGLALPNLKTVDLAVQALRLARVPETGDGLRDRYVSLRSSTDPEAVVIRRGIISALAALQVHEQVIADALGDADPGVRVTASSTLALAPAPETAKRIAAALEKEKDPTVQQGFARSLAQIRRFEDPAVTNVLLGLLGPEVDAGVARAVFDALLAAMVAGPEGGASPDSLARIAEVLEAGWPERMGDKASRLAVATRLGEGAGPEGVQAPRLKDLLRSWVLVEPEAEVRHALALTFERLRPRSAAQTLSFAKSTIERGFLGTAELLLRSLVSNAEVLAELQASERAAVRRSLAGIWVDSGLRAESYETAKTLLLEDLEEAPDDVSLLGLHGQLLLRAQDPAGADQSLKTALEKVPSDLAPEVRKEWTMDRARALLLTKKAAQVIPLLAGEVFEKDRAARLLRATAARDNGDHVAAFVEAEAALALPAPPVDDEILRLLVPSGLRAAQAATRLRAAELLPRLEAAAALADLARECKDSAQRDAQVRKHVEELVAASSEGAREAASGRLMSSDALRVGVWIVDALPSLSREPDALLFAVRILKARFEKEPVLSELSVDGGLTPEAVPGLVELLTQWWNSRPQPS